MPDWTDAAPQGPWPWKMFLYKQNIIIDANTMSKTRNTWELHSLSRLEYVPNQASQQSGWDWLCPCRQNHTRASETKARAREPPLWAAGLLYGDLLCPLVTIKDKPGNFVPSIPVKKIHVRLHLLSGGQAVGLFWLCLAQLRISLSQGSLSLLPMQDGARQGDAILKSWEQTP